LADLQSQKRHFIVNKDSTEGTEIVATTEFLDQAEKWIKLPDYKVGQSYEVEAWLTSFGPDGNVRIPSSLAPIQ
jgi:hypothetical protein